MQSSLGILGLSSPASSYPAARSSAEKTDIWLAGQGYCQSAGEGRRPAWTNGGRVKPPVIDTKVLTTIFLFSGLDQGLLDGTTTPCCNIFPTISSTAWRKANGVHRAGCLRGGLSPVSIVSFCLCTRAPMSQEQTGLQTRAGDSPSNGSVRPINRSCPLASLFLSC